VSRLAKRFEKLKNKGRAALIPYITAGDPHPEITVRLMHKIVQAGADAIELGVPFSDPMADGAVIQAAHERALKHKVNLPRVIEMVQEFRQSDTETPVVLMGYQNPIEVIGPQAFASLAAKAGVDGVLTVDLPPEEGSETLSAFEQAGLDPIFLISPTTREARIEKIARVSRGFIYYVSLKGVTGADTLDTDTIAEKLAAIRRHTNLPVGVGFGIRDAETAGKVAAVADAVVVGSAIIRLIEAKQNDQDALLNAVGELIAQMRAAVEAASDKY